MSVVEVKIRIIDEGSTIRYDYYGSATNQGRTFGGRTEVTAATVGGTDLADDLEVAYPDLFPV